MRRLAVAISLLALAACDSPAPAPAASATAAKSTAPPPPTAAAAPVPAPPDLDVAALQKTLKCGGDNKSGACGVLAKMASCQAWNPAVPSGDGRWIGRGFAIEGAKTSEIFTAVRARRVPINDVGPGQLGARVAIAELVKQEGAAFDQADRVVRTMERSDVPPKGNATLEWLKQKTDWPEAFAMRTAGGQVQVLTVGGAYVCQGAKQTLLVVQRTGSKAGGDGVYAEVWPASW